MTNKDFQYKQGYADAIDKFCELIIKHNGDDSVIKEFRKEMEC